MAIRRYPRIAVDIQATVMRLGDKEESAMTICQLSLGGCLLYGKNPFDSGRIGWITFEVGGKTIRTLARLEYDFTKDDLSYWGASFGELHAHHFHALKSFISDTLLVSGSLPAKYPEILPVCS